MYWIELNIFFSGQYYKLKLYNLTLCVDIFTKRKYFFQDLVTFVHQQAATIDKLSITVQAQSIIIQQLRDKDRVSKQ